MKPANQKTIKNECEIEGVGLHTGSPVKAILKPGMVGAGIVFIRTDLPEQPMVPANIESINLSPGVPRCTTIGKDEHQIHTIEHLMSALAGCGITNLTVELDASELPGGDGSALCFYEAVQKAGIEDQSEPVEPFFLSEPIGVSNDHASIFITPADDFKITYALNYDHPLLRSQFFEFTMTPENYARDIASCRTFCMEEEADELRRKGLGKGANFKNTLVVGAKGVLENEVRFADEFVRHKVLDIVGDLYLLGLPLKGHVFAVKSGHRLNLQLLKKIQQQRKLAKVKAARFDYDFTGKKEIDIEGIMKVLPHRYPFLLVDRVIEIEHGKKAVGIKNVTINDGFFQGHFPTRPVMPGVLMVEAMAQTAGVVVLTNPAHRGKLAFFMAVDNVKFRKVVTAGDQLMMDIEVTKDRSRITQIHAVSRVDGEIVAEADMTFSFTDASYLD